MWKAIPDWPGYEVSSLGQVRSFKKYAHRAKRWPIAKEPQRILRPAPNGRGYKCVVLSCEGTTRIFPVASLVLMAFVGPRPSGMHVCHRDCNKTNNRLDNLRYDTPSGNGKDGAGDYAATRLTNKQAIEVKHLAAQGFSDGELAQRFDVSERTIRCCRLGYSYVHTEGPLTKHGGKLSDQEVQQIRQEGQCRDVGIAELAKRYGVTASHISHILRGLCRQKAGGPISKPRLKGAKSAA